MLHAVIEQRDPMHSVFKRPHLSAVEQRTVRVFTREPAELALTGERVRQADDANRGSVAQSVRAPS